MVRPDPVAQSGLDKVRQVAVFFRGTMTNGVQQVRIDADGNRDLQSDRLPIVHVGYMEHRMLFAIRLPQFQGLLNNPPVSTPGLL